MCSIFLETSQPLSASVKKSSFKAVTCSDIVEALLHKSFVAPGGLTPGTPSNAKSRFDLFLILDYFFLCVYNLVENAHH